MPLRQNNRIFYSTQKVGIKNDGEDGNYTAIHGAQDFTMTTNFNIDPVFELGQLSAYEIIEEIPDIELTIPKVLDGHVPVYLHATQGATTPDLAGRSVAKCVLGLGIYTDTLAATAHAPSAIAECSGLLVSSVRYEFPVEGNFLETVTLVGNDKIWKGDTRIVNPDDLARANALPTPGNLFTNDSPTGSGNVNRRQDLIFNYNSGAGSDTNSMLADPDTTILPPDVDGISSDGTNRTTTSGKYDAHIQNITVSCDFGRTPLNELGRRSPYFRTIDFPTEVTCDIEAISTSGDFISATEGGILTSDPDALCGDGSNLSDRTIRIATCEGTRIYLGVKNKLSSVNYGGGGTDGGNVTVTYSYTNFNDLVVMHEQDGTVNATAASENWWSNRSDYLTDV